MQFDTHTDIWISPMFKQSKICPVFLYICPESVNHSLFLFIMDMQLELQFEDRAVQFTVAPVHAAIIMQFQDQTR